MAGAPWATTETADEIRRLDEAGWWQTEIARKFNMHKSTVSRILSRSRMSECPVCGHGFRVYCRRCSHRMRHSLLKLIAITFFALFGRAALAQFPTGWSTFNTFTLDNPSAALTDQWHVFALSNCDATWWAAVQADGDDVRVTLPDNTLLPAYVYFIDTAKKIGVVYFKRTMADTGTQQIEVWCGNASATAPAASDPEGRNNVFRSEIVMFNPDGIGSDLTSNANTLTATGETTAAPTVGNRTGPIPGTKATSLNGMVGRSQYGVDATAAVTAVPFTMVLVAKASSDFRAMVAASIADSGTSNNNWYQYWRGDLSSTVNVVSDPGGTGTGSGTFTINSWDVAVSVFASSTSRTSYLNAVAGTPNATSGTPTGIDKVTVGALNRNSVGIPFGGHVSHFILYNVAASAAEISYIQSMFDNNAGHYNATPVNFIQLTHPPLGMVYQRTGIVAGTPGSGSANITNIEGYCPPGKTIEARFNGGSWATIDSTTTAGEFAGTLSSQNSGQGTLEVRLSDATSVTDSVADIGIGDNFLLVGHSVVEGRATNAQSYSHATLKAYAFRQDDLWQEADDPIDTESANGSHWPHMITDLMASQGVPIGIVTTGIGSRDLGGNTTNATTWEPSTTAASAYVEMRSQCQASRVNSFLAALGEFGVNAVALDDGSPVMTQATFNAAIDAFAGATGLDAHAQGSPPLVISIYGETGQVDVGDAARLNLTRYGIIEAIDDNADVLEGPNLIDLAYGDNLHPKTDQNCQDVGERWALAVLASVYGLNTGNLAPRITSATRSGTTATLNYDRTLASGTTYSAFTYADDGGAETVNSATRTGNTTVALALAGTPSGTAEVATFADGDTASGVTVPTNAAGIPAIPQAISVSLSSGKPHYFYYHNALRRARILPLATLFWLAP